MRYVWIDTDTGVDDSAALITAAGLQKSGHIRIMGVSTVFGNAEHEKTHENARNVLAALGLREIPVYPGAEGPMLYGWECAGYVHGTNGVNEAQLETSTAERQTEKAWDALYKCAEECSGQLELILLGPETNAAVAFQKYPDLKEMLKRILIMGGADVGGNVTPAAEFNIWADADSAQCVFKSGVPIVMCGLDVTEKMYLTREELDRIESGNGAGCRLFRTIIENEDGPFLKFYDGQPLLHDTVPLLISAFPDIFTGQEAGVYVETRGKITRGKTVSDRETDVKFGTKNVFVVLDGDRDAFAAKLTEMISV